MIVEEHIFGEIQHYVPGKEGNAGSWVTYENGVLSDANVISASCKRQCCEDGKFTIGGVFAATMQLVCRLPGMTRYQLGNARIVLKSQYAGEAQPVPVGTFWATQVSRVRDIFTIRGMDAMGWMDVLVPPFTIDKENSGSHYYLNCIIDMIFFDDALFSYAGYIIQNVMYRMIDSANYWLTDKTGIPDLLSVTAYSETANYGVSYSNRYFTDYSAMWLEDPTTDQAFFRSDKDTNYKCIKPRDIARWCAELFGGFITVNRQGSFEMRQFCQPSLNIAQIQDADAEADSLEIAEYYMYPRKISACGMSRQNGYDTEWDYNLIDTYVETNFTGYDIRIENNILVDGIGPHSTDGGSSLRAAVYSYICGIFQAFVRYEDIDYNWETRTPFPKDQSVTGHIGLFKAYPVPFKCKVHKPERYELGQTVVFPDHPNTFNNYRYGYASHVPYLRSVITSIEWTFRGGTVLSCGECSTRSMMQLSQDSKADAVLRELRNRV